jgi:transcriptional regulator with XRE-family HTH domain
MTAMGQLLDEIREAIDTSDQTRYRIAKETGIAESVLSRLVSGERGLSLDAFERLADHLGLEIILRHKRRRRKRR